MAAQQQPAAREGETIVNYPAGLGTSVAANFKGTNGGANSPSTTVTLQSGSGSGGTTGQLQ